MTALDIIQIISAIAIIVLVLIQQNDAGIYSSSAAINRSRRGPEKVIFNLTIITIVVFTITSVLNFIY